MTEIIRIGAIMVNFLHDRHETDGVLDMFELTLLPDGMMPVPHYHRDWEETIYGLEGHSTWTVDGHVTELSPGGSLFIRRGIVHGFRNDSGAPARCLCVLTPGALGSAYFREVAAAIPPAGPPDLSLMREIMSRYGLIPVPQG